MGAANKRKMSRVLFILLLTKGDERARSALRKDDLTAGEKRQGGGYLEWDGPGRLFSADAETRVKMRQRGPEAEIA